MDKKTKALKIINLLKKQYPEVKCSLNFKNNFQMMVSAMLSAQCSDAAVNKATPALFSRFQSTRDFADGPVEEIALIVMVDDLGFAGEVGHRKVDAFFSIREWRNRAFRVG